MPGILFEATGDHSLQRFTLTCGLEERFSDSDAGFPRAPTVHTFSGVALMRQFC